MNAAYLSALAALAGSAIGGLTSFLGSWVSQNAQAKARLFIRERMRRQKLYRDFVEEGSTLYIDALTHDTADLTKMIPPLRANQPHAHPIIATDNRGSREGRPKDRGHVPRAQQDIEGLAPHDE